MASEKRWLVVGEDGRHVTLGRHTDPSDEEVADAGRQLDGLGTAGWLVVSQGCYYGSQPVVLLMVRQITTKPGDWPSAERRWHERRAGVNL